MLIAPFLVGFHERYLFLPCAASALFLVALVRAARGMLAAGLFVLIAAGWIAGSVGQWRDWHEAARASERLVADLSEATRETGVDEIVLANMPYRVAGASVAAGASGSGSVASSVAHAANMRLVSNNRVNRTNRYFFIFESPLFLAPLSSLAS